MKKSLSTILCVLCASVVNITASPFFADSFEATPAKTGLPRHWRADYHTTVNATITRDTTAAHTGKTSIRITNNSPFAAHVWASLTHTKPIPLAGQTAVNLSLHAKGDNSGRAFVTLVFQPTGGETRIYLPEGTFDWKRIAQNILVPEGAQTALIRIGSEAPTKTLNIDTIELAPCAIRLSDLPAKFRPRQAAADGFIHIFPQSRQTAADIFVLDIERLPQDEKLLATTLQGIVNTTQPRIYLIHSENDRFWLRQLLRQKHIRTADKLPDLSDLIEKFRPEINGATTYDPAVKATKHAAVLLGSLDSTVATSRQVAAKYKLPVKTDLAGKFTKNIQVYRHIWQNHRARLAPHVLAVHHPDMTNHGPRDYLAQHRIFTFWISAYSDPDPAADPAAELEFANEVLAQTPPNIPIMGWFSYGDTQGIPEYDAVRLASSYAKFMAGSEFNTNLSLLSGIRIPDEIFQQHHIVLSDVGASLDDARVSEKHYKNTNGAAAPLDPKILYVSYSVIDSGDSTWYWQHYQHKHWQDPARGSIPINWSMNPTIYDIMPPVTAWFYQNATPNDLLYTAISGLGYMNSTLYASRYNAADREKIWTEYLQLLAQYQRRLDHNILGLYAGAWDEPRATMRPIYEKFATLPNLLGILSDFGRHTQTTPDNATEFIPGARASSPHDGAAAQSNGDTAIPSDVAQVAKPADGAAALPVLHTLMRWIQWSHTDEVMKDQIKNEQRSIDFTLNELLSNAPKTRPAAMSGLILSWTMSPTLTKKMTDKLPPDIRPVRADELLLRARQVAGE